MLIKILNSIRDFVFKIKRLFGVQITQTFIVLPDSSVKEINFKYNTELVQYNGILYKIDKSFTEIKDSKLSYVWLKLEEYILPTEKEFLVEEKPLTKKDLRNTPTNKINNNIKKIKHDGIN